MMRLISWLRRDKATWNGSGRAVGLLVAGFGSELKFEAS